MIDTSKTVGSSETFDAKRIHEFVSQGIVANLSNLEKAIFCLEYVGQLQKEGLDFVFKGGSAVQVVSGDRWNRISVDIDVCADIQKEELESIMRNIHEKFSKKAFGYTQRNRQIGGAIPFHLYRIETPPVTEDTRFILLDAMGARPKFATQKTPLTSFFFKSAEKVTTPTVGSLLGDKLTTIGPTSIGRHLVDSRNGLEYAKHLFDIGGLQQISFNITQCRAAYTEAMETQSKIRGKKYAAEECFADMLFTCQVASLPQRAGEQAIRELHNSKAIRAASEFRILQDGLRRFRPFLIQTTSYTWDDLRNNAARAALVAKILISKMNEAKATQILSIQPPNTKEQILNLMKRIEKIRKDMRWFIVPDEIVNFPKILSTWHSFFYLEELS
ncbi:MAG: nucleotidyl transferase AbiEii/AbiGii toxin family protein [Candidatus Thorarchaeota archaeon]